MANPVQPPPAFSVAERLEKLVQDRDRIIDSTLTPLANKEELGQEATLVDQMINGLQQKTLLATVFFHSANLTRLQHALRYHVKQQCDLVIGYPARLPLALLMRDIYLEYAMHRPHDIKGQIASLNGRVISKALPLIVNNVMNFQRYLQAFERPTTLPAAVNPRDGGRLGRTIDLAPLSHDSGSIARPSA